MGNKCFKTKIPGKEIESDFTLYLYNIEGFLDIENGFFFILQNLIWIMKHFNESKMILNHTKILVLKYKYFWVAY